MLLYPSFCNNNTVKRDTQASVQGILTVVAKFSKISALFHLQVGGR